LEPKYFKCVLQKWDINYFFFFFFFTVKERT
jgi:hypothetical protein